jgi:hypothetical protein
MSKVKELFAPTGGGALVAIWHAMEFCKNERPLCKIYLNPAARGRRVARSVIAGALDRLGFGAAVPAIYSLLQEGDLITHFAIDLVAVEKIRVKIYVRHFCATPTGLQRRAEEAGLESGANFADFCENICPSVKVLSQRPVMSCYHLTASNPTQLHGMTLYLPLYPYALTDRIACERISTVLAHSKFDDTVYRRIADQLMSERSCVADSLHTYVAYKQATDRTAGDQVTAYFNPSLFQPRFGRLALDPDRFWPSPS